MSWPEDSKFVLNMNIADINAKKRDYGSLLPEDIAFVIREFSNDQGRVSDEQMAALAMAICINGMNAEETACLTSEMLNSGARLTWPSGGPPRVDKHSTGGIGDKVSLVLAPLLACCGLNVPMISGRGLGPTGGTLDKLESIPGFDAGLPLERFQSVVDQVGCAISSASEHLVPADRKLYRLRDVTGTVKSVPLITASIMSKKLAEGLNALVLDVKCGRGAFMKTIKEARSLAESLVRTGKSMGLNTVALITDMNQPLGRMVGNAIEVNESVDALSGAGPSDLMELTFKLGGELLVLSGFATDVAAGIATLESHVASGAGLEKFADMVAAQGGDLQAVRQVAPRSEVVSHAKGYVSAIDAEKLGFAIIEMGGGRKQQGDNLDHSVGIEMFVRIGDTVETGQPIANLFAQPTDQQRIREMIQSAVVISTEEVAAPALLLERIE